MCDREESDTDSETENDSSENDDSSDEDWTMGDSGDLSAAKKRNLKRKAPESPNGRGLRKRPRLNRELMVMIINIGASTEEDRNSIEDYAEWHKRRITQRQRLYIGLSRANATDRD